MHASVAEILEQHAEESSFLWLLRNGAVDSPEYTLPDLAQLDDRIEAHLDGLRMTDEKDAWEVCEGALAWEEPGEVFTGSVLACESADGSRIEPILEKVSASPDLSRGLVSALGWVPFERASRLVQALLESGEPSLQSIGIAACAAHRHDPGRILPEALKSVDKRLCGRALRTVGQIGRRDLLPLLLSCIEQEEESCRFWAAWSTVLLGEPRGTSALRETVESGGPFAQPACDLAMRGLDPAQAHSWQASLSKKAGLERAAILGAAALGDPAVIPWLIERMSVPELARLAGGAFSMITGVAFDAAGLEGQAPDGFEAGPTEDPEDEDVTPDADDDLPWPEPEAVREWWKSHRASFPSGTRLLLGTPLSDESLETILRSGTQPARAAAAVELAIRNPGRPLFEVRMRGDRQLELLSGSGS